MDKLGLIKIYILTTGTQQGADWALEAWFAEVDTQVPDQCGAGHGALRGSKPQRQGSIPCSFASYHRLGNGEPKRL